MWWAGESLAAVAEAFGLKKPVKPCKWLERQWEQMLFPEGIAGCRVMSLQRSFDQGEKVKERSRERAVLVGCPP